MKTYKVKTKNGNTHYMLAKNNKEMMKLAGKFIKWYGEILLIEDDEENIIVQN